MKRFILSIALLLFAGFVFSQSNVFPSSGNAGIGTTSPTSALDIRLGTSSSNVSEVQITAPFLYPVGSPVENIFHVRKVGFGSGTYYSLFGINTNGNVGVGIDINDPLLATRKMVITDGNRNKVDLNVRGFALIDGENASLLFGATGGENYGQWGIEYNEYSSTKGLNFWKPDGSNNFGNYYMFLADNGKISMGLDPNDQNTFNGDYRLYVADGIITERVKVAVPGTTEWADYVFEEDYDLLPLEEVETFVEENGHLPNVPSAEEVVTQGIDMAKMDAKLLEKIEELTLYIIEQEKRISELEAKTKQ